MIPFRIKKEARSGGALTAHSLPGLQCFWSAVNVIFEKVGDFSGPDCRLLGPKISSRSLVVNLKYLVYHFYILVRARYLTLSAEGKENGYQAIIPFSDNIDVMGCVGDTTKP
jgi:hypothetical protein